MMNYDRIDVSEGIDIDKTSASKKCNIFNYWYYLDKWFKFQPDVCNECHEVLMISMNLSNIDIINTYGPGYYCIISRISKREAIDIMQNIDLTDKSGTL